MKPEKRSERLEALARSLWDLAMDSRIMGTVGGAIRSTLDYPVDPRWQGAFSEAGTMLKLLLGLDDYVPSTRDVLSLVEPGFVEPSTAAELKEAGWTSADVGAFLDGPPTDRDDLADKDLHLRLDAYAEHLGLRLVPKTRQVRLPVFKAAGRPLGFFFERRSHRNDDEWEPPEDDWRLPLGSAELTTARESSRYWLEFSSPASLPGQIANLAEATLSSLLGILYALDVVKFQDIDNPTLPDGTLLPGNAVLPSWLVRAVAGSYAVEKATTPSEFEERQLTTMGLHGPGVFEGELRQISRLFDESEAARVVRSAARFFLRAVVAETPGETFASCGICLEALLLEQGKSPQAVVPRLSEAVCHVQGAAGPAERAQRRRWLKSLYDERSKWVHQGRNRADVGAEMRALTITAAILRTQILSIEAGG